MPTSFAEEMTKLGEAYTAPFVKLMEERMEGKTLEEVMEEPTSSSPKTTLEEIDLLVDGDLIAYRAAAAAGGVSYRYNKNKFKYKKQAVGYCVRHKLDPDKIERLVHTEPEANAIHNVESIINRIAQAYIDYDSKFHLYLSGNTNFRTDVAEDYKKNRAGLARPVHLDACKQHLVNKYGAIISDGCEADDLVAIHAHKLHKTDRKYSSVSLDKDFDMIPGEHFNWVKDEKYYTHKAEGKLIFYRQILTGDSTDNIPGLKKVGPKTAEKLLPKPRKGEVWWSDSEMYTAVIAAYLKRLGKKETETDKNYLIRCIKQVTQNARQLWLQTYEGEMWQPPKIDKVKRVQKYLDSAMKLSGAVEAEIKDVYGDTHFIDMPTVYQEAITIAGRTLADAVDAEILKGLENQVEEKKAALAVIAHSAKEIERLKMKAEMVHAEAATMIGTRRSAMSSRPTSFEKHKEREIERLRHKRYAEDREAFAGKYDTSEEYFKKPDKDASDKLLIRAPKNVCPEPLVELTIEEEKSPETKLDKARSWIKGVLKS